MAFTVTATPGGPSFSRGVDIEVRVFTNATESGGASNGGRNTAAGTAGGSLTPNFSSSAVVWSITSDTSSTWPAAAASNAYDTSAAHNHTDGWESNAGHYTGTVTAGTPLTYGAGSTATSADHENWCAYEVPAQGGTITLDGSSPTSVTSDTGTSAVTASFTPPIGSVLVVLVAAGGNGAGAGVTCSISDTSGLSLIWTQRVTSSTTDNFQPTFIFTATVPAASTGKSTTGWPAIPGPTWKSQFRQPQHVPEIAPSAPVPVYPPQVYAQPGVAWKGRYHLPQRPKPIAPVLPPYIAGLTGGAHGYFVDQNSAPRLYYATVPWGMPANAGRWNGGDWRSDFDGYFAAIKAQGMTAAEMHPWGHSHTGCNNDLGNTWDSVSPWTTIPTLNDTFWQRIDALLNTALNHGITVLLVLNMQCDMGVDAFAGTGVFNGVSASTIQTACQNIAARYVNQPNLIFFQGDDYNNDDDTRMQAVVDGLHAGGYTGPTGVEEYSSGTTSRRDLSASPTGTPFVFGGANATFNWCYYYNVTYFAVEQAYKENNQIPVLWGDGYYVGPSGEPTDTHLMRNFVWWALASGARGCSMGSETILNWTSTAMADVTVNQLWYVNEAKAVYTAFTSLTGWQNLLPDLTSALVTAGRGTRAAYSSTGFLGANLGTDNYVAASITPDHSLAVIYCAVAMSITIDQTQLGAGYTATWVDPASGATQSAATGSTYNSAPLGSNSASNADWVLVLQGPAIVNATPAAPAAQVSVVAPAATTAVTATAGVAAVAGVATPATTADTATAGVPAVATVAPAATTTHTATAAVATVLAVAPAATDAVTVTAGVAIVNAVALQPTVTTSGNTNAPAGVAAAAAAAPAPVPAIAASAAVAASAATAPAAVPAVAATAGVAVIGVAAPQPTVTTSGNTNAPAAVAIVAAVAPAPSAVVTVSAAVTTGRAVALAPSLALTVSAAVAVVAAVGVTVPPSLANAVSHPAVTGQTAGNAVSEQAAVSPAVTQQAASAPAVSGG